MKRGIALLAAVCMLIVICSGCLGKSDEELIRDRMNTFLTAYNSGDLQGVLQCMDAKTRNTYQSALNIGNVLIPRGVSGLRYLFPKLRISE